MKLPNARACIHESYYNTSTNIYTGMDILTREPTREDMMLEATKFINECREKGSAALDVRPRRSELRCNGDGEYPRNIYY